MALNFELDEETQKHMEQARLDEINSPPEPERPEPSVTVEGGGQDTIQGAEKTEKVEKQEKSERPRNPDGTFAPKTEVKADEKPAPKAAEKPLEAPKVDKAPEGYVPHGAFHEERERRKAIQKQVEQMEKRFADLIAKMQEKPASPPPDPNQDFPGHVQHHFNQFATQQTQLAEKVQNFEAWQQQQAAEARFMQAYSTAAQDFAGRQTDFGNAYQHWLKSRMEELTDAGYSQDQALQIRTAEERGIVAKAFEDGVNPAERLYAVAKRRGYTIPSAAASPAVEKPAVDPAEKAKQIEAGQRATPQMGGGAMKPKLTLQAIAGMSDAEFAALDWESTMRELAP